jgi:hypothetical protein
LNENFGQQFSFSEITSKYIDNEEIISLFDIGHKNTPTTAIKMCESQREREKEKERERERKKERERERERERNVFLD